MAAGASAGDASSGSLERQYGLGYAGWAVSLAICAKPAATVVCALRLSCASWCCASFHRIDVPKLSHDLCMRFTVEVGEKLLETVRVDGLKVAQQRDRERPAAGALRESCRADRSGRPVQDAATV